MKLNVPGLRYKVDCELIPSDNGRLFLKFGWCPELQKEIKESCEDAKWHGFDPNPVKMWSIPVTTRNQNVLKYLSGVNIYAQYDKPLVDISHIIKKYKVIKNRFNGEEKETYGHQFDFVQHNISYLQDIWAGEMGTGKTLAAMIAMQEAEYKNEEYLWIGTKGSLRSTAYEFRKWEGFTITPRFINYEKLRDLVETWKSGTPAPRFVVIDESSRVKNRESQRSKAVKHISDSMRKEYGLDFHLIEMSGSPAPKNPADWWNQCEIAYPGFLREGNPKKFMERLALSEQNESLAGGRYSTILTWWDDERKCAKCGEFKEKHSLDDDHIFKPSVNEVAKLYERMKGLVIVKLKKDCLKFLPEKRYEQIVCPPTQSTLRTAKVLAKTARNVMTQMTILREYSDGFLYEEKPDGFNICPTCNGTKKRFQFYIPDDPTGQMHDVQPSDDVIYEKREIDCTICDLEGRVPKYVVTTRQIPSPKEDALNDLLENHEDVGRVVIYGAFTGTIDRVVDICCRQGWTVLRVDGRGWSMFNCDGSIINNDDIPVDINGDRYIHAFQEMKEVFPRIAFVGQPGAAGMGLTLTASPSIIYYSNDFNAESRIQSEDRIHRPGMDLNRGATIYDIIHLPTDSYILDNLKKKKEMQSLTMGEIEAVLTAREENEERVL
jgi:hypothetical protein